MLTEVYFLREFKERSLADERCSYLRKIALGKMLEVLEKILRNDYRKHTVAEKFKTLI